MAGTPDSKTAEPHGGTDSGKVGSPACVDVICGTLRGKFLLETWRVIVDVLPEPLLARCKAGKWFVVMLKYSLPPGEEVGPRDFERRGGRAQSKKWKESVRLFVDGSPSVPIGRWLAQQAPAQTPGRTPSSSGAAPKQPAAQAPGAAALPRRPVRAEAPAQQQRTPARPARSAAEEVDICSYNPYPALVESMAVDNLPDELPPTPPGLMSIDMASMSYEEQMELSRRSAEAPFAALLPKAQMPGIPANREALVTGHKRKRAPAGAAAAGMKATAAALAEYLAGWTVDLRWLHAAVEGRGGEREVAAAGAWSSVSVELGLDDRFGYAGESLSCIYEDLVLRFTRPQKKVLGEAGPAAAAAPAAAAPAAAAPPGQIPLHSDPAAGVATEPGQTGPGGRAQARARAGSAAAAKAGEPGLGGRAQPDAAGLAAAARTRPGSAPCAELGPPGAGGGAQSGAAGAPAGGAAGAVAAAELVEPGPGVAAQSGAGAARAGALAGAQPGGPGPGGRAVSGAGARADAVAGEPGPGGKGQSGAGAEAVPGREPGEVGLDRSPQPTDWTQVAADAAQGGVGRGGGAQSYAAGAPAADAAQAGSVPGAEQAALAEAVPKAEPGESRLSCRAELSAALAPGAEEDEWEVLSGDEEDEWEIVPDSADEAPHERDRARLPADAGGGKALA